MLVWYLKKGRRKYLACRVIRPLRAMNCCGTLRPRCCTCSASRSGRDPVAQPRCRTTCWTSIGYSRVRLRRSEGTTLPLSTQRGQPVGPTLWGASTMKVRWFFFVLFSSMHTEGNTDSVIKDKLIKNVSVSTKTALFLRLVLGDIQIVLIVVVVHSHGCR